MKLTAPYSALIAALLIAPILGCDQEPVPETKLLQAPAAEVVIPRLDGTLNKVPKGQIVQAKNGKAELNGKTFTLLYVIDWGANKGWDGQGRRISSATLEALGSHIDREPQNKTTVVVKSSDPAIFPRAVADPADRSPASASWSATSNKGRINFNSDQSLPAKSTITLRFIDTSAAQAVSYVVEQARGESNGFTWSNANFRKTKSDQGVDMVQGSIDYTIPEHSGIALNLLSERDYSFHKERPASSILFHEQGSKGSRGLEDDVESGVYWVWLACPIHHVQFQIKK